MTDEHSIKIDPSRLAKWYSFQARFYHLWRDNYAAEFVNYVVKTLRNDQKIPESILDIGCGTGLFSIALAEKFPNARVTGVDFSDGMIKVASRAARFRGLKNVTFVVGDAQDLGGFADQKFDAVVAAGLIANLTNPNVAAREMLRVLVPGGSGFIVEFDDKAANGTTRAMISALTLGYRVISKIIPQFRFTRDWRASDSYVDKMVTKSRLADLGARVESIETHGGNFVLWFRAGSSAT